MNKKVIGSVIAVIVICATVTAFLVTSSLAPSQEAQTELDFSVSGKNECLRFLTPTVQTVYIPFRTGANENWQLTVNATKMPGGANGSTDVYLYKGYWDNGTDHKCLSQDIYPILTDIQSAEAEITSNSTYTRTFGSSTPESYTVFFIFPPGGEATFQVTLKHVN